MHVCVFISQTSHPTCKDMRARVTPDPQRNPRPRPTLHRTQHLIWRQAGERMGVDRDKNVVHAHCTRHASSTPATATYSCTYIYAYICICICIYVYIYIFVYKYACTYVYACVCIYIYVYRERDLRVCSCCGGTLEGPPCWSLIPLES